MPIEGGRSIPDETISLAQKLNRRFPRKASTLLRNNDETKGMLWQRLGDRVKEATSQSSCVDGEQQPDAEKTLMDEKLLRAFESATVQNYYKKLYGTSTDFWINPHIDKRHPNANKYAAVAIAKAMSDVKHGKDAPKDFAAFIEACLKD